MRTLLLTTLGVLLASTMALADWNPGDGHKMHYPQLPDPWGWDVAFNSPGVTGTSLADDWQCSQTGTVDDIHFWVSVRQWTEPAPNTPLISPFRVQIRADVPAGTIPNIDYSTPGSVLWTQNFDPTDADVKIRWYGTGDQGWYDPWAGVAVRPDHTEYFQLNLTNLGTAANPAFTQKQGDIYWLEISMPLTSDGREIGWKTSESQQFMDDAVYGPGAVAPWQELYDPQITPPKSLDLAFVITPEPATIGLLGMGGLALLRRKRKA